MLGDRTCECRAVNLAVFAPTPESRKIRTLFILFNNFIFVNNIEFSFSYLLDALRQPRARERRPANMPRLEVRQRRREEAAIRREDRMEGGAPTDVEKAETMKSELRRISRPPRGLSTVDMVLNLAILFSILACLGGVYWVISPLFAPVPGTVRR